ncbi:hypothetical protein AVEN_257622-1 [Araneus ventricosus]|uniref:Uncharacterized protein n=1 Tax=Araneus ventricosus TaxID=182803 RepID=A0A4Y2E4S8_ARAVE|nr:hypothetical protein AVEN_257622-1 [Araneus ventricosus]
MHNPFRKRYVPASAMTSTTTDVPPGKTRISILSRTGSHPRFRGNFPTPEEGTTIIDSQYTSYSRKNSYTGLFGDRPHNFEPESYDEDDTCIVSILSKLPHQASGRMFDPYRVNVHRPATLMELGLKHVTQRYQSLDISSSHRSPPKVQEAVAYGDKQEATEANHNFYHMIHDVVFR